MDSHSGLVHTAEITTARAPDAAVVENLLHGEETFALMAFTGDRGYASTNRALDAPGEEGAIVWGTPFKRKKGCGLTHGRRRISRFLASPRANAGHVFRVIKRQSGYVKTRYRGLYKNGQQIMTLLALANIFTARRQLAAKG